MQSTIITSHEIHLALTTNLNPLPARVLVQLLVHIVLQCDRQLRHERSAWRDDVGVVGFGLYLWRQNSALRFKLPTELLLLSLLK